MDEIIQYILKSPENTNPNVMRSLLGKIEGTSGDKNTTECLFVETSGESSDPYQVLNRTFAEIYDAYQNNIPIFIKISSDFHFVENVSDNSVSIDNGDDFVAVSPSEYPRRENPDHLNIN